MRLYYLSFADPTKPTGKQWLGGAYVEAESFAHAVLHEAPRHGCNPGGEVASIEIPFDAPISREYRNRLLDSDMLRRARPDGDDVLVDFDGNELEGRG
jgi:hypothetical protein